MELTSFEQEMLDGKYGEGMALAMKVQVGTGRAFYAKRMVPITRAHVAASAQQGDIYFVTKLVDAGARCIVPPTTNPSMDLEYVSQHLWEMDQFGIDNVSKSNEAYRKIGAIMTLNCTPELEKNVPAFGEIVAFSESSATPYVNSVLGARSNRESSISALCAAVTGRVPEYGFLLDENRLAEVVVEVEAKVEEDFDWHLLGYAYPQVYKGGEVPVFTGITKRATPEGFVQFGAELATSGSVAHVPHRRHHPRGAGRRHGPRRQGAEGHGEDHPGRPRARARAVRRRARADRVRHVRLPAPHHPPDRRGRRADPGPPLRGGHLDPRQQPHAGARRPHGLPGRPSSAPAGTSSPTPAWTSPAAGTSTTTGPASPSRRSAPSTARCTARTTRCGRSPQAVEAAIAGEVH